MPEVVMPRLSDSMEEGTIVRWLKQDGERVSEGEPLAEVETDKATVTFDADAEGTLQILVAEGETVRIGGVIARIGEASVSAVAAPPRNGRAKASPLARRMAREAGIDLSQLSGSGPGGRIVKADVSSVAPAPAAPAAPAA
ncbi:MAG: E3 binding domain-containing protein, partial [Solirubrobacterales bacterium]|nr:E3 binding domain-containing protein [Solirubrobacterales bacterium]